MRCIASRPAANIKQRGASDTLIKIEVPAQLGSASELKKAEAAAKITKIAVGVNIALLILIQIAQQKAIKFFLPMYYIIQFLTSFLVFKVQLPSIVSIILLNLKDSFEMNAGKEYFK